jgi:hypothetical protein
MPRHHSLRLVVAVVVLAACGGTGTSRPSTIPQPGLDARLLHEVFFGSQSSAPATVEIRVLNRAPVPIKLRRVEIGSYGMGSWGILRRTEYVNETIPPGEERSRTIVVTAVTNVRNPTEPLQLRATYELEAGGVYWREILIARQ